MTSVSYVKIDNFYKLTCGFYATVTWNLIYRIQHLNIENDDSFLILVNMKESDIDGLYHRLHRLLIHSTWIG